MIEYAKPIEAIDTLLVPGITLTEVLKSTLRQRNEGAAVDAVAHGEHFSHAQGGAFNGPEVGRVLDEVRGAGFEGVGQSYWGPTGFIIVDSVRAARTLLAELRQRFGEIPNLDFKLDGARESHPVGQ